MDEREQEDGGDLDRRLVAGGVSYRNGKMFVTRSTKAASGADEQTENIEIEVQPFVSAPAYVNVRYGVTINLGDFESARIEVGLSMPAYPEDVDRVFDQVQSWVGDRIEKERREVESEVKRRKD